VLRSLILILSCAGLVHAQLFQTPAGTVVYFDKAAYLNATGPLTVVSLPAIGPVTSPKSIGPLTFSATLPSKLVFGCTSGDGSSLLPGNELGLSDLETFQVAFPPTREFGFDFVEPTGAGINGSCTGTGCNWPTCTDTTFVVTLRLGGAFVDMFSFNAPDDQAAFVGWLSPYAFDRVEFVDGTNTIDNEFWGSFYVNSKLAWTDLGFALPGFSGEPTLTGTGTLAGGAFGELDLTDARPSANAALFFGLSQLDAPFKGGVLVPFPMLTIHLVTSGSGTVTLPFTLPAGLPAGLTLYFQYWIQDAAASSGFAASNGLEGVTP
jgi:hypothetical protein